MSQALDDSSALGLDTLEQFATYEDYLDSHEARRAAPSDFVDLYDFLGIEREVRLR